MATLVTPYRLTDSLIPLRGALVAPPGDPTTPAEGAIDVAAVTASADDGNVAANAIDGDLSTRWSAQGDGQWIRFDLGDFYDVGAVDLAWHRGDERVHTFTVELSGDDAAWTPVFHGKSSGTSLALEQHAFPGAAARYVRVTGHGNSINTWNSITEAEVIAAASTPDAPPATPSASAVAGSGQVSLGGAAGFGPVPTSYRWRRGTTSGGPYATLTSGATPAFTDTQVNEGTTYHYVLDAINADGTATSTQVSATPGGAGSATQTTMADIVGLGLTAQEVQMMRQRAGIVTASDPGYVSVYGGVKYKSWGDVSANSPNDWDRITSEAGSFSTSGIWNGTMSESAVNETNAQRGTSAALKALLEGDATLAGKVLTYLNNQANAVNLSAKSRASSGDTQVDTHPMMDIAPKLFCDQLSWSWVEQWASSGQRSNILNYLDEGGDWLHDLTWGQMGGRFVNRDSTTNFDLVSGWQGTRSDQGNQYRIFHGGPFENDVAINRYNNRFGASIGFVALSAVYFNNATRWHNAWRWSQEFIRYGIYVDGGSSDMYREFKGSSYHEAGLRYATGNLSFPSVVAMLGARGYRGGPNGDFTPDRSLYDLVATAGTGSSTGAPKAPFAAPGKSLGNAWLALGGYPQETYSPARMGHDGSSYGNSRKLDGITSHSRSRYINHTYAVYAQLYYQDPELEKLVLFNGVKQLNGYPPDSQVMRSGSTTPWRGSQRNWPGHMFMYAQSPIFPFPVA